MSTFYFSGIEKRSTAEVLIKTSSSGMLNQIQYSPNLLDACGSIPLVLDSGAYSKALSNKDIESYAQLISLLGDRCDWYDAPDAIGNQEKSIILIAFLLSILPEYLHERVLWIYQYGSDLAYLHQGMSLHKRIGIGGLVPIIKQNDKRELEHVIYSLAREVAQYSAIPHYFGLGTASIIKSLHTYHQNFSVDNTSWLVGGKFGLVIDSSGIQRPANGNLYNWSIEAILEQNVRTMKKWVEPNKKEAPVQLSWI
jgi:hypothetical protein